MLYRMALKLSGFDVVDVEDGLDALQYLECERPDAIVLDLGLPRVGGRDVHRELRAHAETSSIPVVIITGGDTSGLNEAELACLIRKPVSAEALVEAVERCLRVSGR
jgi:DNA-binding response OmpR family regulator